MALKEMDRLPHEEKHLVDSISSDFFGEIKNGVRPPRPFTSREILVFEAVGRAERRKTERSFENQNNLNTKVTEVRPR